MHGWFEPRQKALLFSEPAPTLRRYLWTREQLGEADARVAGGVRVDVPPVRPRCHLTMTMIPPPPSSPLR
jgi:hypothetical protein